MSWQQWVLLAWLFLGAVSVNLKIGEPRKPLEPVDAALSLVLLLVLGLVVISI